jgi:hypothetical protein
VVIGPRVVADRSDSLEDDGRWLAVQRKRQSRCVESRSTRTTEMARPPSIDVAEYSLSGAVEVTRVVRFVERSYR